MQCEKEEAARRFVEVKQRSNKENNDNIRNIKRGW